MTYDDDDRLEDSPYQDNDDVDSYLDDDEEIPASRPGSSPTRSGSGLPSSGRSSLGSPAGGRPIGAGVGSGGPFSRPEESSSRPTPPPAGGSGGMFGAGRPGSSGSSGSGASPFASKPGAPSSGSSGSPAGRSFPSSSAGSGSSSARSSGFPGSGVNTGPESGRSGGSKPDEGKTGSKFSIPGFLKRGDKDDGKSSKPAAPRAGGAAAAAKDKMTGLFKRDKKPSSPGAPKPPGKGGGNPLSGITSKFKRDKKDNIPRSGGASPADRPSYGGGAPGGGGGQSPLGASKVGSAAGRPGTAKDSSKPGLLSRFKLPFGRGGGDDKPQKTSKTRASREKTPHLAEDGLSLDQKLDLLGVGLVISALVLFFSALSNQQGALTGSINTFFSQLLGWGMLGVPLAMAAIGVWLIVRHFGEEAPEIDPVRLGGVVIFYIGLLMVFMFIETWSDFYANATQADFGIYVAISVRDGRGGGWVGAELYTLLVTNFGEISAFVFVVGWLIVAIMLMTRTSAAELAVFVISVWRSFRVAVQHQLQKRAAMRLEQQQALAARQEQLRISKPAAAELQAGSHAALPAGDEEVPIEQRAIPIRMGGQMLETPLEVEAGHTQSSLPLERAAEKTNGGPFGGLRSRLRESMPAMPAIPALPFGSRNGDEEKPPTEHSAAEEKPAGGLFSRRSAAGLTEGSMTAPVPSPAAVPAREDSEDAVFRRPFSLEETASADEPEPSAVMPPAASVEVPPAVTMPTPPPERTPLHNPFKVRPPDVAASAQSPAPTPTPAPDEPAAPAAKSPEVEDLVSRLHRPRPSAPAPELRPLAEPVPRPERKDPVQPAAEPRSPASVEHDPPAEQLQTPAAVHSAVPSSEAAAPETTPSPERQSPGPLADRLTMLRNWKPPSESKPAVSLGHDDEDDFDDDDFDADFDDDFGDDDDEEITPAASSRSYKPFGKPSDGLPGPFTQQTAPVTPTPRPTPPVELPSRDAARPAAVHQPPAAETPARETPRPAPAASQKKQWNLPDYRTLLASGSEGDFDRDQLVQRARIIEETLASFGSPGKVVEINTGPVITQFGVEPDYLTVRGGKKTRVKVGAIAALDKDLQLALGAKSIRVEAPVPGKGFVGIEVPNAEASLVSLRDVMESRHFTRIKSPLAIALGQSVDGAPVAADLTAMPHLLIAGTTGSGKSVCVNAVIASLLVRNSPDQVRFIMVDPKRVELTGYNGIPHLVAPVVVELERIIGVLKWVTREMDNRYKRFSNAQARNITDYNTNLPPGEEPMPYIVVIIDELADLMMMAPDETERVITRIAALARATGIHLVIATQRPSVDVVTGLIKANFPARIAFAVAGGVDSRVILDQPGAERLLGKGDMLYMSGNSPAPVRLQGVYVSDMEIANINRFWKAQAAGIDLQRPITSLVGEDDHKTLASGARGVPAANGTQQQLTWDDLKTGADHSAAFGTTSRDNDDHEDELYKEAVDLVRRLNKASVSLLQRRLRIGYTRAARLIDVMEAEGVVGPPVEGSKPREVMPWKK